MKQQIIELCEYIISEHDELKKFQAGFGNPESCNCEICQKAKAVLKYYKEK